MPSIQLDDLTVNNVGVLKKINETVLPVTYSDKWYEESLKLNDLVKLAFYNELPVGAIRGSIEVPQNHNMPTHIYIMTLAVLKPYRGRGIGQMLLDHIIEHAKSSHLDQLSAHASCTDNEALQWYLNRGFEKVEQVKNYYKDIGDAWLLVKKF